MGVTVVGVLYLLLAIVAFLGAVGLLVLAGLSHSELVSRLPNAPIWLTAGGTILLSVLGLIVFLVAVVDLLISVGCFRGWGWIWTWALVFAVLNIFFSMFNAFSQGFTFNALVAGLVGAVIPIVVLFYLNTRKVKEFFGKA